jgi:hypothetical protein
MPLNQGSTLATTSASIGHRLAEYEISIEIVSELKSVIDQYHDCARRMGGLILELARRMDETKTCGQSEISRWIKYILIEKD